MCLAILEATDGLVHGHTSNGDQLRPWVPCRRSLGAGGLPTTG